MRLTLGFLVLGLLTVSTAVSQTTQFRGSVPLGTASATPLALTFRDAIDRALKANLGLLVSDSASESARGQRLRALSALLPQLDARAGETIEQISLKTIGFNLTIPGVNIPNVVGPFHYTDVRAYATWNAFDYSTRKDYRSAVESRRAAQLSVMDARDLVVEATANAYLQIVADASRIEAIRSQVETAQALYDRTADQQQAGTAAGIDVLRSQVELKQQQQRLLAERNQFDKDKLALGRVIGLPNGQEFNLSETAPFAPLTAMTQEQALLAALAQRPDYQSGERCPGGEGRALSYRRRHGRLRRRWPGAQ
jgi:outer membrane protein TolC